MNYQNISKQTISILNTDLPVELKPEFNSLINLLENHSSEETGFNLVVDFFSDLLDTKDETRLAKFIANEFIKNKDYAKLAKADFTLWLDDTQFI